MPAPQSVPSETPTASRREFARPHEFPIREYIGAMADELARLARFEGDEALALILEAAVNRAAAPTAS